VKRPEHADVFREMAVKRGLEELPAVCIVADVCREELLFEIDAETAVAKPLFGYLYHLDAMEDPDQPNGWLGGTVKVYWPILVNLRLDPFERTAMNSSLNFYHWFVYQFRRFVYVQQEIAKAARTFLEYPPMQKGATFNLEALKQELQKKMEMMQKMQSNQ
jgi:hypothetical protein